MWFWYALGASALWGVGYVINQLLMKTFSPIEILILESIIILIFFIPIFVYTGQLKLALLKLLDAKMLLLVLFGSIIYISAAVFILKSIATSNASLAAIIEASYPIFTMFFAFVLLGEIQFSLYSIIGCIVIIIGLAIVHYGQN